MASYMSQRDLSAMAEQTKDILSDITDILSTSLSKARCYELDSVQPLDQKACPGFKLAIIDDKGDRTRSGACVVRVVNEDTLDAALTMYTPQLADTRVCVLNFANETIPGGAWLSSGLAQEESLCHRTSLHLSLSSHLYPISVFGCIYSPTVAVIRQSQAKGYNLLPEVSNPDQLPAVSVISVAAIRTPKVRIERDLVNGILVGREVFALKSDREMTRSKMRLALRIAAKHGHTHLVLGALGCGDLRNPTDDVAHCWKEVIKEPEFVDPCSGSWFRHVIFAVLGISGQSLRNYILFHRALDNAFNVLEGDPEDQFHKCSGDPYAGDEEDIYTDSEISDQDPHADHGDCVVEDTNTIPDAEESRER